MPADHRAGRGALGGRRRAGPVGTDHGLGGNGRRTTGTGHPGGRGRSRRSGHRLRRTGHGTLPASHLVTGRLGAGHLGSQPDCSLGEHRRRHGGRDQGERCHGRTDGGAPGTGRPLGAGSRSGGRFGPRPLVLIQQGQQAAVGRRPLGGPGLEGGDRGGERHHLRGHDIAGSPSGGGIVAAGAGPGLVHPARRGLLGGEGGGGLGRRLADLAGGRRAGSGEPGGGLGRNLADLAHGRAAGVGHRRGTGHRRGRHRRRTRASGCGPGGPGQGSAGCRWGRGRHPRPGQVPRSGCRGVDSRRRPGRRRGPLRWRRGGPDRERRQLRGGEHDRRRRTTRARRGRAGGRGPGRIRRGRRRFPRAGAQVRARSRTGQRRHHPRQRSDHGLLGETARIGGW